MNDEIISEPVMYVGPSILRLGVMQFQTYTGGLPQFVKRAVEQIPEIEMLIVPVSKVETIRTKINNSGTYEARMFYKIQKEAEKIRKEKRK